MQGNNSGTPPENASARCSLCSGSCAWGPGLSVVLNSFFGPSACCSVPSDRVSEHSPCQRLFNVFSSFACRFEAFEPHAGLRRSKSLRRRAPRPAAGPPTRAIAGARARSHHGHREATKTPQLQRLLFTEKEDQPRAARRAEDEARVLLL